MSSVFEYRFVRLKYKIFKNLTQRDNSQWKFLELFVNLCVFVPLWQNIINRNVTNCQIIK